MSVLAAISRAADKPTLPSRQASVVVPLLKQISPTENPQNVLAYVRKVLGDPDPLSPLQEEEPVVKGRENMYYRLDDNTEVGVMCIYGKLVRVGICRGGGPTEILYRTANAPS